MVVSMFTNATNPQITDILVTGVPGNFNRPPGETFS